MNLHLDDEPEDCCQRCGRPIDTCRSAGCDDTPTCVALLCGGEWVEVEVENALTPTEGLWGCLMRRWLLTFSSLYSGLGTRAYR